MAVFSLLYGCSLAVFLALVSLLYGYSLSLPIRVFTSCASGSVFNAVREFTGCTYTGVHSLYLYGCSPAVILTEFSLLHSVHHLYLCQCVNLNLSSIKTKGICGRGEVCSNDFP